MSTKEEWRRLTAKYKPKYFAFTEAPHPNPEHVKHSFSGGLRPKDPRRFWAFKSKRDFDHFCGVYKSCQCLDPGS